MTLAELANMRRLRAKPAFPIVITDQADIHEFCATNDLPVMWQPAISNDADLRPLHGLDVWVIGHGFGLRALSVLVNANRPDSMWMTGRFAFASRINCAIGREAMICR